MHYLDNHTSNQMVKSQLKQKLSLDQHTGRNTLPSSYRTNVGNHFIGGTHHPIHNHHTQLKPHIGHHVAKPRSKRNKNDTETGDSYSETESVDEFELDGDDVSVGEQTTSTANPAHYRASNRRQGPPSIISTDLDTTTFFDDEEDDGQFSSITEQTASTMSSRHYGLNRNRRRMRHKVINSQIKRHNSLHSSVSSVSDSTMSLNIITVTLNMGQFKKKNLFEK